MGWFRGHLEIRASLRLKLAVAFTAGGLLVAPVVVLASHQFTDVPTGNLFHKEIGVVADAGIAQGFGDGTYKPLNAVTRQAMAAFLERSVGRAGSDTDANDLGTSSGITQAAIANVSVNAGAAGTLNTGFVVLIGSVTARTQYPVDCPCLIKVYIAQDGEIVASDVELDVSSMVDESGQSYATASIETVVPINGDESRAFQLVVTLSDADAFSVEVNGTLTALYVPLAPDGDDTLAYEHTCISGELEPNDSEGSANPLPGNGCRHGKAFGANADYFSFSVPPGQTLTLETRSADGAGCGGDTTLAMFDALGTPVDDSDDEGIGTCSRLVDSGLPAGTYLARVRPFSTNDAFEYRITATLSTMAPGAAPDEADVDDVSKD
jgi:hypothetical protein